MDGVWRSGAKFSWDRAELLACVLLLLLLSLVGQEGPDSLCVPGPVQVCQCLLSHVLVWILRMMFYLLRELGLLCPYQRAGQCLLVTGPTGRAHRIYV